MSLLEVSGLGIAYGDADVVSGLSFDVDAGESVGLVGESGSGKTQTALAIMGLLPPGAAVDGSIVFDGEELLGLPAVTLCKITERVTSHTCHVTQLSEAHPVHVLTTGLAEPFCRLRARLGVSAASNRR